MRILLALPLLLAACVESDPFAAVGSDVADGSQAGPVRVVDLSLRSNRVTLRMSDGARCVSLRPEGEVSGWSGVTTECPYQLPVSVTFVQGGDASRFTIEENIGAPIGEDGKIGPRAEVYVTDVDGNRKLFLRPIPGSGPFQSAEAPSTVAAQ